MVCLQSNQSHYYIRQCSQSRTPMTAVMVMYGWVSVCLSYFLSIYHTKVITTSDGLLKVRLLWQQWWWCMGESLSVCLSVCHGSICLSICQTNVLTASNGLLKIWESLFCWSNHLNWFHLFVQFVRLMLLPHRTVFSISDLYDVCFWVSGLPSKRKQSKLTQYARTPNTHCNKHFRESINIVVKIKLIPFLFLVHVRRRFMYSHYGDHTLSVVYPYLSTFWTFFEKWWMQFDETWKKVIIQSLYQVCVFQANRKQRLPPWPLIAWDILDIFSAIAKLNSTKIDRNQT